MFGDGTRTVGEFNGYFRVFVGEDNGLKFERGRRTGIGDECQGKYEKCDRDTHEAGTFNRKSCVERKERKRPFGG